MKIDYKLTVEGGDTVLTFKTLRGALNYVRVEYKTNSKESFFVHAVSGDNSKLLFTLSPLDAGTLEAMLNNYMVW